MRQNSQHGAAVAETAATLALLLPLAILILFVVLEASYAYLIKTSLAQAARQAARDLAIAYGQNPDVADNRSLQDALVFDQIRINKMVHSARQFDDPLFQASANPPTVRVVVRYASGQYGLPPFPNPDPLKLGEGFQIDASSTYRLE